MIELRGSVTLKDWAVGIGWARLWGRPHVFLQVLCFHVGLVWGEWSSDVSHLPPVVRRSPYAG